MDKCKPIHFPYINLLADTEISTIIEKNRLHGNGVKLNLRGLLGEHFVCSFSHSVSS